MPQSKQRVWFAVLLVDSQFAQGAFRRSERAHWSALDAREELNGWVDAMKLGPVAWDELSDKHLCGPGSRLLRDHSVPAHAERVDPYRAAKPRLATRLDCR
jgi:hypothetical protein